MKKFGDFICKNKIAILIISLLLLIPAFIGYANTKINYDILVYLPEDIETMKGQNILKDEFNMGAFTIISVDNSNAKEILDCEKEIRKIESVNKVISINDITGTVIPLEILPDELLEKVKNGDKTLMMVTFEETTSHEKTLNAITEIREIMDDKANVGGMSAIVKDTMDLSNKEVLIYVVIAVVLCLVVLTVSLDSYVVPFILLGNIGIAIIYNMGTNIMFGEISYITKAISAVLQLGVTTDFSIFLYHKYQSNLEKISDRNEAMAKAIEETLVSVLGSAFTTVAGFLALCSMNLTLGKDIGLVMAKGVIFGLICVVTVFPAMLLILDKYINKTKHKSLLPKFNHIKKFSLEHYKPIFIAFLILLIPAYIGNHNVNVYYNLDKSLPKTLESVKANGELKKEFNIVSPEIVLLNKNLKINEVSSLVDELKNTKGIDLVLSPSELTKYGFPLEVLDDEVTSIFENDNYQMLFINSSYEVASPELTSQLEVVNNLVHKYDKNAIIAGEGPLTNDLIKISDEDFKNVNYVSIGIIFVIMFIVLKSLSLPVLLISAIEFAIFVNVAISYYTGVTLPFIASIVIGTIQLGATIDYAILMTTKYLELRNNGKDKNEAMKETLDSCVSSVFVSGMCFFAATFGVGVYTDIDLIGSICTLISRGAIISMLVVILILPSLLMLFDGLIMKTTYKGKGKKELKMKKKVLAGILIGAMLPLTVFGTTKDETVYSRLESDGSVSKTIVSNHIQNIKEGTYNDRTNLKDIVNTNGDERFDLVDNSLTWSSKGEDIFYKGTSTKSLPIKTTIKYYLDGKEYTSKELNGKSGNVKIVIKYENTSKKKVNVNGKKETLYTPFMVTSLMTFNKDNITNLKVDNAKIVDNGISYMVLGYSAPGLYESLNIDDLKDLDTVTIEYTTTSYEFTNIYSVATSNLFEDVDTSSFSDLNKLYSSVNKLGTSTKDLVNGSNDLKNGIKAYNDGFVKYNDGMNNLDNSVKGLVEKYNALNQGIQNLNVQVKGLSTYTGSIVNLATGINNLSTKTNELAKQSELLSTTVDNTLSVMTKHIETLTYIKENTTDENTKKLLEEEITNLQKCIDFETLSAMKTNIDNLNSSISALNKNVSALASSSKDLITNVDKLAPSVNYLATNSNKMNEGIEELSASVDYLTSLSNTFNTKNSEILKGATTLYDGLNKFNKEGISKITSVLNGKVKTYSNKIEKLIDLGNEYNSFSMKEKNTDGKTKFIMMISE